MALSLVRNGLVAVAVSSTLFVHAADGAIQKSDASVLPEPAARESRAGSSKGVWTAERKRAAMRNCEARFVNAPDRLRACLRTIPIDGDWATLGPR